MTVYSVSTGGVVNAQDVTQFTQLLTGTMTDQQVTVSNRIRAQLTGAVSASGYVGGTAGGPPTSGTFAVGDTVIDNVYGGHWTCVSAGTPGTWVGSYTPISQQTLGSNQSTVTFSSIPQKWSHLAIYVMGSVTSGGQNNDIQATFNGDVGAHYSMQSYDATSAPTNVAANANATQSNAAWFMSLPGTGFTTTPRGGMNYAVIPAYTNTSLPKLFTCDSVSTDAGSAFAVHKKFGYWSQTSAITSISLSASQFASGSYFGLYGIP